MIHFNTTDVTKFVEDNGNRANAKQVVLNMMGVDIVDLIKTEMVSSNSWVTGDTGSKLSYVVKENGLSIEGAGYTWNALETGRQAGRMPPVGALKRWARMKLGDERLAIPIARSIAKKGTPAKGLMTNVFIKLLRDVLPKRIAYLTERWTQ